MSQQIIEGTLRNRRRRPQLAPVAAVSQRDPLRAVQNKTRARKRVASLLLGILVAACGSDPSPSAEPTVVGPSGAASSSSGNARSGGPSEESGLASTDPPQPQAPVAASAEPSAATTSLPVHTGRVQMAASSEGGLYVVISAPVESVGGPPGRSTLALLDSTGAPHAGWPIVLLGWTCDAPGGGNSPWPPASAADGSVRLLCYSDPAPDGTWHWRAFAFDSDARSMAGWPVDIPGAISDPPRLVGDVLYAVAHRYDRVDSSTSKYAAAFWIVSVDAAGTLRVGKHFDLADAQHSANAQLGRDGSGYLVTYLDSATGSETQVTSFDLGGLRSGWPTDLEGLWSLPAFGPRGRIYMTAVWPDPRTTRTLVFDRNGRAVPVGSDVLPIAAINTRSGAGPSGAGTIVADDGTAFILSDADGRVTVFRLDAAGQVMAGWPYKGDVGLQWLRSCLPRDTGCGQWLSLPAVGPEDMLYVPQASADVAIGGSILALDPNGRVHPGWPVALRRPGWEFSSIVVSPAGTAFALAVAPDPGGHSSATVLAIAQDSTVLYRMALVEP